MDWRNELYHHETPPPGQAWDKIAEELNGDPVSLRQRLREWEATPPPSAWEHVREVIGHTTTIPSVPAKRTPIWQYAAAAAVIIGTALGIYFISPRKDSPIGPELVATSLIPKDSPLGNSPAQASTPSTSTPSVPAATTVPTSTANLAAIDPGHPHTFKEYHAPGIKVSYTDGNYIKVRSTDGKDHRVSYKCAVLIPCLVSGTTTDDQKPCADDLKNWKKKLGESGFIPAGDNFFDIAGMARMLESSK